MLQEVAEIRDIITAITLDMTILKKKVKLIVHLMRHNDFTTIIYEQNVTSI